MRAIALFIGICATLPAWAADGTSAADTWYVRPVEECPVNGDGLGYDCAEEADQPGAFSGFAIMRYTAVSGIDDGDTVRVCGEFDADSKRTAAFVIALSASGSAGKPIIVDGDCSAHRENPARWTVNRVPPYAPLYLQGAIIDGQNIPTNACITTNGQNVVTFRNMALLNCTAGSTPNYNTSNILSASSQQVIFERLWVGPVTGNGFTFTGTSKASPVFNNFIQDSLIEQTGAHGVTASKGARNNVIRRNEIRNIGLSNGAHGISFLSTKQTLTSSGSWSAVGGGIYSHVMTSFTAANPLKWAADVTAPPYDFLVEETGDPTAPAAGEFGFVTGTLTLYVHLTSGGSPASRTILTHADDVVDNVAEYNYVHGARNWEPYAFDEGHGIVMDDGVQGAIIRGNVITDFDGNGINCNKCTGLQAYGNIITGGLATYGLGNGINLSYARSATVANNTIANNTGNAIHAGYSGTVHTKTLRNNAAYANTGCPVKHDTQSGALTESNTAAYQNGSSSCFSLTTPVTADPMFIDPASSNFRLRAASPLCRAGLYAGRMYDATGARFDLPPPIGAYSCLEVASRQFRTP